LSATNIEKKIYECNLCKKIIISPKKIEMLKFLCKKITLQWFILFGLIVFAIYTIFAKTQIISPDGNAFLFKNFIRFFSKNLFLGKLLVVFILLAQIVLIQYYFKKNDYSAKTNLLPACFYITVLLVTKSLICISPFIFTLLFFLIIISINYTGIASALKNNAFWVGILIAIATSLDFSSAVLLVIAIITLIINHFSKIKEISILIFGFILVYLYFFSYHFFMNNHIEWLSTFQQIKFLGVLKKETLLHTPKLIALPALFILYLYFIMRVKYINDSKVVVQRKRIITLNTRAVLMMTCILISNSIFPQILGYLFIHISVYLALLSQERSPLYFNEFVTIVTFVVLCL
jgi:hypothetical protein